jgi:hypothetical protein
MKVGLSFSRCLRDIVEARVNYTDILVIIARTDFDPHNDEHWKNIWDGYRYGGLSNAEWADAEPNSSDEDAEAIYRNVAKQLYDGGKLHQPRQFREAHPPRMPYYWLDCSVPESERSPAAQKAWEQYQIISGLSKKQRVPKDDF